MNCLVIAAGGKGNRMKSDKNKIFLKLNKKPIIFWTLKIFEESPVIDKIILSARINDLKKIGQIIQLYNFKKILAVIPGGNTRQETIINALFWLKTNLKNIELVGIHNAANPFVMRNEIKNVFSAAKKFRAALLAHPARDTVKITNGDNLVSYTPIRETCWYAQTPQVAYFNDLFSAFKNAQNKKFIGTDDTQLLEKIKIKSKIVPCSQYNFKITYPEDLILAKKLLPIFLKEDQSCIGPD